MALDIVGPASAPNSTTIRPADTRTFGATDTWAKDCSSPTANDGTKIQAGWLNGWMGQLRNLIRGNGLTAGAADIVPQDNTDDSMALKAVQHLIQRGQMSWASDVGAVNALAISLSPAPPEYKTGMTIRVFVANTNTGPCTLNVNGLGANPILSVMTQPLVAGALVQGSIVELVRGVANVWIIVSVLGTASFSMPKAIVALAAISSFPFTTYVSHGLTLTSSDSLAAAISTNTFTLPAGTYIFMGTGAQTMNNVINPTNCGFHLRVTKNGTEVGHSHEADALLVAGQNLTVFHNLITTISAVASDVFAIQAAIGTTLTGDYNGGSAGAGVLTIIRIGP